MVITHGNGPVVADHAGQYYRASMGRRCGWMCAWRTARRLGHLLMQGIEDELARAESERRVACVITRVAVSADDEPSTAHQADRPVSSAPRGGREQRAHAGTWRGRGPRWRYVVPSPAPRRILELDLIGELAKQGVVVIAAGGGGIPMVLRADNSYGGVPAVVDKDLTSALLATGLGYDTLLILTAVQRVAVHFGTPRQRALETVGAAELDAYRQEGHFAEGSMGPKVQAPRCTSSPAAAVARSLRTWTRPPTRSPASGHACRSG